jgi:hypothetical protein
MSKPAFRVAIELLKKAKKVGAEPAVIAMLEQRVKEEAQASYERFKTLGDVFPVLASLEGKVKLSDILR